MGRIGERLAARYLQRSGWRILARRLRTTHGEIDILARLRGTLVCVEVKTGVHGPRFRPGGRLRPADLRRRWRSARALGRLLGLRPRVDVIEVLIEGRRLTLVHHEDVRDVSRLGAGGEERE